MPPLSLPASHARRKHSCSGQRSKRLALTLCVHVCRFVSLSVCWFCVLPCFVLGAPMRDPMLLVVLFVLLDCLVGCRSSCLFFVHMGHDSPWQPMTSHDYPWQHVTLRDKINTQPNSRNLMNTYAYVWTLMNTNQSRNNNKNNLTQKNDCCYDVVWLPQPFCRTLAPSLVPIRLT